MSRVIRWSKAALKSGSKLEASAWERAREAVAHFTETGQGDVKRLKDVKPPLFRLRVGDLRVLFSIEADGAILIAAVRHRGSAYRDL